MRYGNDSTYFMSMFRGGMNMKSEWNWMIVPEKEEEE